MIKPIVEDKKLSSIEKILFLILAPCVIFLFGIFWIFINAMFINLLAVTLEYMVYGKYMHSLGMFIITTLFVYPSFVAFKVTKNVIFYGSQNLDKDIWPFSRIPGKFNTH